MGETQVQTLEELHHLRREVIFLRRSVWPLREVVSGLERVESGLIQPSVRAYLKDVYDHTIHIIDTIETFRDMLTSMVDIYHSSLSYRMSEVVKVLTIIATIFIPPTFVAGIYGMNFKHMPELQWPWAYPVVLAVTLSMIIGMFFYFRKKHWLGMGPSRASRQRRRKTGSQGDRI